MRWAVAGVAALSLIAVPGLPLAAQATTATPAPGSAAPRTVSAQVPSPAAGQATVAVVLKAANGKELTHALPATAGNPTAAERRAVAALLPTDAQRTAVTSFAAAHGLQAQAVGDTVVDLIGAPDQLAALFGTTLAAARGDDGHTYRVARTSLRLPGALAAVASGAVGLDDRPVFHRRTYAGGYTGSDLNSAYRQTLPGAGAGVTVATAQFSGWYPSDLQAYANALHIPLRSGQISQIQAGGSATSPVGGGDVEVALDQEAILATAPQADQRIYFGGNTTAGIMNLYSYLAQEAQQGKFQVLSTSWGSCEPTVDSTSLSSLSTSLSIMASYGVTVFAATGDSGAYDCATQGSPDATVTVDYPASDPSVVAVGGTTLTAGSGGYSETGWSSPNPYAPGCATPSVTYCGDGSGGGASSIFARPSYQSAVGISGSSRLVPDVAADADPSTGFAIVDRGSWMVIGGTSLGAPTWAGQLASVLSAGHRTTGLGDIHAALYAHPGDFRDVTSGNNYVYNAGTGYDEVTGLGSPQWALLGPHLLGWPTGALTSTSTTLAALTVSGTAIDPDTTAAVPVTAYVDVTPWTTFLANGANHTFNATIANIPDGRHGICLYANDLTASGGRGDGPVVRLGCTIATIQHSPIGSLDVVSTAVGGAHVAGWVLDPDTSAPTMWTMYVDVTPVATGWAAASRPDIANAFPGYGPSHGFAADIYVPSGRHAVCLQATNIGLGTSRLLGCKVVTVSGTGQSGPPIGSLDRVTQVSANTWRLQGWVIDPDYVLPTDVHVYAGSTFLGLMHASTSRPDVGAAFPGYGSAHGFDLTVTVPSGARQLCAYGFNVGPAAANTTLGCTTIG